mmetsp:Transcript_2602/g.6779  ORF Transcript_2602/g.6779 Transcript_2602/m.6779 type:complete len:212 (-) Transcript_2602:226-861(-)
MPLTGSTSMGVGKSAIVPFVIELTACTKNPTRAAPEMRLPTTVMFPARSGPISPPAPFPFPPVPPSDFFPLKGSAKNSGNPRVTTLTPITREAAPRASEAPSDSCGRYCWGLHSANDPMVMVTQTAAAAFMADRKVWSRTSDGTMAAVAAAAAAVSAPVSASAPEEVAPLSWSRVPTSSAEVGASGSGCAGAAAAPLPLRRRRPVMEPDDM